MEGFSSASPPQIFWKSRKRPANGKMAVETLNKEPSNPDNEKMVQEPVSTEDTKIQAETKEDNQTADLMAELSEKRKALFEPLEPTDRKRERISNEDLLPPPDFDETSYPKGWLVGKKRKLVNVDVVESMRRIAVQEMNRKDREIDGLNEQLDEDARVLQHLQLQLVEEKRKRVEAEREREALQQQVSVLTNILAENQSMDDEEYPMYDEGSQGLDEKAHDPSAVY
ncbi:Protein HEADING DATE REPRESSOR 1 [Rhynchospora pubera]|uniref:Protein HEADING DATE REPRESSOR 1 n=1 Tax=Rhynchospora pubera TaxID=906938 RepID=A0AAV8CJE3_9POAL|nr:Protein HEADING DATE REPRESSOR 1 [Rhynchospora pubera]